MGNNKDFSTIDAEVESISLAYNILKEFGAKDEDFEIRINHRGYFPHLFQKLNIPVTDEKIRQLTTLIDRKNKISEEEFNNEGVKIIGQEGINKYKNGLNNHGEEIRDSFFSESGLSKLIIELEKNNITNIKLDSDIARGFDYYTGIVFEVFDTDPANNRSLFGGGRYDNLLEMFGVEALPTVGFGMGDVTMRDFLETHNLLPKDLK